MGFVVFRQLPLLEHCVFTFNFGCEPRLSSCLLTQPSTLCPPLLPTLTALREARHRLHDTGTTVYVWLVAAPSCGERDVVLCCCWIHLPAPCLLPHAISATWSLRPASVWLTGRPCALFLLR